MSNDCGCSISYQSNIESINETKRRAEEIKPYFIAE